MTLHMYFFYYAARHLYILLKQLIRTKSSTLCRTQTDVIHAKVLDSYTYCQNTTLFLLPFHD